MAQKRPRARMIILALFLLYVCSTEQISERENS